MQLGMGQSGGSSGARRLDLKAAVLPPAGWGTQAADPWGCRLQTSTEEAASCWDASARAAGGGTWLSTLREVAGRALEAGAPHVRPRQHQLNILLPPPRGGRLLQELDQLLELQRPQLRPPAAGQGGRKGREARESSESRMPVGAVRRAGWDREQGRAGRSALGRLLALETPQHEGWEEAAAAAARCQVQPPRLPQQPCSPHTLSPLAQTTLT
jgi:hypothetical protein